MASQHIEIPSTASRLSADVRRAIDTLEALQSDFQEIKNVMDQVASDSDWASLATYLGTSQADAESVYNLWTAANTSIRVANLDNVQARLG